MNDDADTYGGSDCTDYTRYDRNNNVKMHIDRSLLICHIQYHFRQDCFTGSGFGGKRELLLAGAGVVVCRNPDRVPRSRTQIRYHEFFLVDVVRDKSPAVLGAGAIFHDKVLHGTTPTRPGVEE